LADEFKNKAKAVLDSLLIARHRKVEEFLDAYQNLEDER